jgi:hypothetical protein
MEALYGKPMPRKPETVVQVGATIEAQLGDLDNHQVSMHISLDISNIGTAPQVIVLAVPFHLVYHAIRTITRTASR